MSTQTLPQNPQILPAPENLPQRYDPPHVAFCLLFAPLMVFAPRTINRHMVGLSIWKAAFIGAFYLSLAVPFLKPITYEQTIAEVFYHHPMPWFIGTLICLVAMQWLAILPFAARPGSNRAALIHATRTVLLMLFWLPLTGLILWNLFPFFNPHIRSFFSADFITGGSVAVLIPITLWTINVIRALGVEYRTAGDLAAPRDPLCDECGYDLTMSPQDTRCPECGKSVAESLSAASRNPSQWEQNPSLLNPRQVWWQLKTIFTHPMKFFASIPLRTDHSAARRWLVFSLMLVGLSAALLGPALSYLGATLGPMLEHKKATTPDFTFGEWQLYAASFAIGMTWLLLGLLMVGIETGGMAIIGYFRNYPIDLSCTAKVTSYASTYLLAWVFPGAIQILCIYLWTFHSTFRGASERVKELVGFGSTAFIHIAGLVIFEWVVYAGLRKIQFSNK